MVLRKPTLEARMSFPVLLNPSGNAADRFQLQMVRRSLTQIALQRMGRDSSGTWGTPAEKALGTTGS